MTGGAKGMTDLELVPQELPAMAARGRKAFVKVGCQERVEAANPRGAI